MTQSHYSTLYEYKNIDTQLINNDLEKLMQMQNFAEKIGADYADFTA